MRFLIGMCPKEIIDDSVSYESLKDAVEVSSSGNAKRVTLYMCQTGDECRQGLHVTIGLCPTGETCGCEYAVSNFNWYDTGHCYIRIGWTNPDQCILQKIILYRYNWWELSYVQEYIHERVGIPGNTIYPEGDARNDLVCFGCGIGGEREHPAGQESFLRLQNLVPGQIYRVRGYFRDVSCGGVETPIDLGTVLYETTGFTSGYITAKTQVNPPKFNVHFFYRQESDGAIVDLVREAFATDYYDWQVGDAVMISKINTTFPGGSYDASTITNTSFHAADPATDYFIAPYRKQD